MAESDVRLMSADWRTREAAQIADLVETLRRASTMLADSLEGVDLVDSPSVVDEIVAQLRPIDIGRVTEELNVAAERLQQAVSRARADDPRSPSNSPR